MTILTSVLGPDHLTRPPSKTPFKAPLKDSLIAIRPPYKTPFTERVTYKILSAPLREGGLRRGSYTDKRVL